MKTYRLTITPLGPFHTLLQSDTIFGHLMWALRYVEGRDGEKSLRDFLGRYRAGEPPLLLSAGFPAGYLPAPVLRRAGRESDEEHLPAPAPGETKKQKDKKPMSDRVVEAMLVEVREAAGYIPLAQWRNISSHLSPEAVDEARKSASRELETLKTIESQAAITRTAVDRITGSAREARLFVSEETFYRPGSSFEIWHRLADEELAGQVDEWWRWIERNGFGRSKSSGRGNFRIEGPGLEPADGELPQAADHDGFMSLSSWLPAADDPTDVTYRTLIKRGKLAEQWALPSPWKKPLIMLGPGAVARLREGETVKEWYGRLAEDVHWTQEEVVQYGYALPLPVRLLEGS